MTTAWKYVLCHSMIYNSNRRLGIIFLVLLLKTLKQEVLRARFQMFVTDAERDCRIRLARPNSQARMETTSRIGTLFYPVDHSLAMELRDYHNTYIQTPSKNDLVEYWPFTVFNDRVVSSIKPFAKRNQLA